MDGQRQTLDQVRARFAWEAAEKGVKDHGDKYRNLAKGAPALVMGSGLMPTLAFLKGKDDRAHDLLLEDLCQWLGDRFSWDLGKRGGGYETVMQRLHEGSSDRYMAATQEALAILKWIRQYADAVPRRNGAA